MDEKRRIVIVGEGFVGGAVLKKCISMGENCLSITRADADLSHNASVERLTSLILPTDYVVFSAAKAPAKSFDDYQQNLQMVKNFVEACQICKPAYILNISSDAIYADHKTLIDECSLALPGSFHGLMHLSREIFLKISDLKVANLRPTLIYGADDPHNSYGPNSFYRLAKENKDIVLFGKGEELRDHVHVDDVGALAHRMLSETIQEDLNAVTGEVISFYDIAKIIITSLGSNSEIITTERKGRMPHEGYRAFENKKVKDIFANFSFKSFKNGVNYFSH